MIAIGDVVTVIGWRVGGADACAGPATYAHNFVVLGRVFECAALFNYSSAPQLLATGSFDGSIHVWVRFPSKVTT